MLSVLSFTLGCKLNQLESESATDAFVKAGFKLYNNEHEQCSDSKINPSIIIINTCTVTSKADQKARRIIRKALQDYPESAVIVTGCYAELEKEKIEGLEDFSCNETETQKDKSRLFTVKKDILLNLPADISNRLSDRSSSLFSAIRSFLTLNSSLTYNSPFQFNPSRFSSHTRSFLKIQDGCSNCCTYCRIRLARGKSVSLPAELALERLRILEENYTEAVLTGVNISQYLDPALKNKGNLCELLNFLLSGTKKIAIRLSSLAPESIDVELAKVLSHKRIRPHFHLSVQSGSEKILESMGRNYSCQTILDAADLLRSVKDDPFLACDIIAGFPGETEIEFNKTYELCKKIGFAWIHVFPYSKRPGTPAFDFKNMIHEKEVTKRVKKLTDLAFIDRQNYVRRWYGREVDVLAEKGGLKSYFRGISENYLKLLVHYEGKKPSPGSILRCRLLPEEQNINNKKEDHTAVLI